MINNYKYLHDTIYINACRIQNIDMDGGGISNMCNADKLLTTLSNDMYVLSC